jgi:hypothetical protein
VGELEKLGREEELARGKGRRRGRRGGREG